MYFDEPKIVKEYLEGKSAKQIAEELGTYNTSIRRVLIRNKVTLRGNSEAQTNRQNVFKDLDNPKVQYWLGMLASDGTIHQDSNRITLELQERDLEHIQKYAEFVTADVRKIIHSKLDAITYRVNFRHKSTKTFLTMLGITSRKSETLCMNIPITPHFLRGVFDGDGYVRIKGGNKGSYEIATMSTPFKLQISSYLKSKNIHHTLRLLKSDIWIIGIYTQSEVRKFYDLIYSNATVFLEKKKAVICPLYEETL